MYLLWNYVLVWWRNLHDQSASESHYKRKQILHKWSLVSELLPASWLLKMMFKVSALIRLAGITGTRLLGPYFLPPRLTGGSLPRFTAEGPSRAVARCCSADYDLFMVHITWCCTTFSSCRPRVLEQRVYWTFFF